MTIPKYLIDKALDAWIGDHNCPHPGQIGIYRVLLTRSLQAVAPEIWQEGEVAGGKNAETVRPYDEMLTDEIPELIANPYRASETA